MIILRRLFKLVVYFLGSIVLYLFFAILLSVIPVNTTTKNCSDACVEIYILSNGVHTDIVVPLKTTIHDYSTQLNPKLVKEHKNYNFASIGWGDKGFYLNTPTWAELKFSTAFNALFYLSDSAMHVSYYEKLTENELCKKISIPAESYKKIIETINQSFTADDNGNFIPIAHAHYGSNDVFYEAESRYSLFKTCNTWTNNVLKAGNLKACLWTPFDKGIFYHYTN